MDLSIIADVALLFALAVPVTLVCSRLQIPVVAGLLFTGFLAGPGALGLVEDQHHVEALAEIGIILLMFSIGLEVSLGNLYRIKKFALIGGPLQILLSTTFVCAFIVAAGKDVKLGIALGMPIALSSTAIVVRIMQQKAKLQTPYGQAILGILIFQDLALVLISLITPALSANQPDLISFSLNLLKGITIVAVAVAASRWVMPWVFFQITRTRIRELFILSVLTICMGVTWISFWAGLSMAVGAFLAGLMLSESEYAQQALGSIIPFRDVFS
ncbi:MAG: cation:proton antiporter, partial [Synergistales bacterium]|nr:cation:proton antiporter [Synergistales bacterium]